MSKGISDETREKWKSKIETCWGATDLNDWEREFIDDIQIQIFDYDNDLTMKQSSCLNKIYDKIQRME